MQDIAHDEHLHSFHLTEFLTDTVGIEQGLRRVLMGAITGVHEPGFPVPAQELGGTRVGMALLEEVARATAGVRVEPAPRAFLVGYGESSIDYSLRYWIDDPLGNLSIQSAVSQAVWHAFSANGIEMPFPQRVIHPPNDSDGPTPAAPAPDQD